MTCVCTVPSTIEFSSIAGVPMYRSFRQNDIIRTC